MSEAQFNKAVEIVGSLPKTGPAQITDADKLEASFYKYFKQAKIGNVNISRPYGLLDFEGRYKWDAWNSQKDVTKEASYKNYVEKLIKLLKAAGDEISKKHVDELEALEPEAPLAPEVLEHEVLEPEAPSAPEVLKLGVLEPEAPLAPEV